MNQKIISIEITPENESVITENGGVMWEHNAGILKFSIDSAYVGDYRYYLEYRSLMGTKTRTDYLELNPNDNTITYSIPATMTSLKGVECYFNIVKIDEDGNTVQVIKPKKFGLTFDYSPETDNSLCKEYDFSINSLLEAIRLGTFKGDRGEKGEKGDKGDKGETGGISEEQANNSFSNALKGYAEGEWVVIDDISPIEHKTAVRVHGKNLFNGELLGGHYNNEEFGILLASPTVFKSIKLFLKAGAYTISFGTKVNIIRRIIDNVYYGDGKTGTLSYTFETTQDGYVGFSFRDSRGSSVEWLETTPIQIEKGNTATEFVPFVDPTTVTVTEEKTGGTYTPNADGICEISSVSPVMTISTDTEGFTVECEYNRDINKIMKKVINTIIALGGSL